MMRMAENNETFTIPNLWNASAERCGSFLLWVCANMANEIVRIVNIGELRRR